MDTPEETKQCSGSRVTSGATCDKDKGNGGGHGMLFNPRRRVARIFMVVFWMAILLFAVTKYVMHREPNALVMMSDFGTADGAVSAMKGVAFGVDRRLPIFDLTHEIPEYDIWQGAYRLRQVVDFWPAGTVFVSVVDPGVGTSRSSVVAKSKSGHYFVNPNNGLLTLISELVGIEEMRHIDETKNRLANSYDSYTFHGRDVYAYTAARLAAGHIRFSGVGEVLPISDVVVLPYTVPKQEGDVLKGMIPLFDSSYGNVWTNIPSSLFKELAPEVGEIFTVRFYHDGELVAQVDAPYRNTFGEVREGLPLLYLNSLLEVSVALNMANFAQAYGVGSGSDWTVEIAKKGHKKPDK